MNLNACRCLPKSCWSLLLILIALLSFVSRKAVAQQINFDEYLCAEGAVLEADSLLCIAGGQAIGPFPEEMVRACITWGGGEAPCRSFRWHADLARSLRGSGRCPLGSTYDSRIQACHVGKEVFGPFTKAQVRGCLAFGGGNDCYTNRWHESFLVPPEVPQQGGGNGGGNGGGEGGTVIPLDAGLGDFVCPEGAVLEAASLLCIADRQALGPFPEAMVKACMTYGGGEGPCRSARWSADLARSLRGTGRCLAGTTFDAQRNVCRAGSEVFGPFTKAQVRTCLQFGGAEHCFLNRWHASFVAADGPTVGQLPQPPVVVTPPPVRDQNSGNKEFAEWYITFYDTVYRKSVRHLGTTSDGCATFASIALREYGYSLPVEEWAPTLREIVQGLGWRRITDPKRIQPGDVVFTEDEESIRTGETGHVFVVRALAGPRHVYALDNQGSNEHRNLYRGEAPYKWWFWEAYRPPLK